MLLFSRKANAAVGSLAILNLGLVLFAVVAFLNECKLTLQCGMGVAVGVLETSVVLKRAASSAAVEGASKPAATAAATTTRRAGGGGKGGKAAAAGGKSKSKKVQ